MLGLIFVNSPCIMNVRPRYINAGGVLIDLEIPKVMGILNVTPDSFFSESRYPGDSELTEAAIRMHDEGAAILDIGGYSSRPGAGNVTAEEEGRRVFRAINLVLKEIPDAVISVDTFRSDIAREAILGCGAHIINDITGGEGDPGMIPLVEELKVPYIIMHMRGNPRTMQSLTDYDDVVADILRWFAPRIQRLQSSGVKDIIIDPGFGFSKTIAQNFEIIRRLKDFSVAGLPVMAGVSRKSSIWKTLGITPDKALNGTTVMNTIALMNGADILRVHDVKEAVEAIKLVNSVKS
jgi:dihydropteroate synthase